MAYALKLCTNGDIQMVETPEDEAETQVIRPIDHQTQRSLMDWMCQQIGCSCVETVYPQGLERPFLLVIDEEGLLKEKPTINFLASWLYHTQDHGQPIVGTALIMREVMTSDGPNIGGVPKRELHKLGCLAVTLGEKLPFAIQWIRHKLEDLIKP